MQMGGIDGGGEGGSGEGGGVGGGDGGGGLVGGGVGGGGNGGCIPNLKSVNWSALSSRGCPRSYMIHCARA